MTEPVLELDIYAIDVQAPDAAQKFEDSFKRTGFAILKNHGFAKAEIDAMYAAWSQWFAQGDKESFAVKAGEGNGYFGFKSENAKGFKQKDLKEFFHAYQNKAVPSEVEEVTRAFQSKMIALGTKLLGWLDQTCPDEVKQVRSQPFVKMVEGSDMNLLRILHYPPLGDDVEQGEVRAAAHEDINLITLLVTGSEPGLQAQDLEGNWLAVPCNEGYITVNSGDMLKKATAGYYPSTPHRVVNPEKSENRSRYSLPLFMHPRPEVKLDEQSAQEYLNERLKEIGLKN